jgi:hypothetical protein
MWHAVASVISGYDPALIEKHDSSMSILLILNAGPGTIQALSWSSFPPEPQGAAIRMELRPGDQQMVEGCVIRAHLISGNVASIAWRLVSNAGRQYEVDPIITTVIGRS